MFLVARDKTLEPIAYDIPYTNLLWIRRWYDFGEFQMQIPLSVYDPDWAFITSPDQENMAMIQKRQYSSNDGGTILLSGFFAEKALDRAAIPIIDLDGELLLPWMRVMMISYYKDEWYGGFLKIHPTDYLPQSPTTNRVFDGEMGSEYYKALQEFEMSQIVKLDSDLSGCTWYPLVGVDRSNGQDMNMPVILSTAYGDFSEYAIDIDESCYKNVAFVRYGIYDDPTQSALVAYLETERVNETVPAGMQSRIVVKSSATATKEAENEAAANKAIQDGRDRLYDLKVSYDIDVTLNDPSIIGDVFDLGDLVTVKVEEASVEANIRAVEITETYNRDGKSVQVGFGNKRISNIRRAMI